MGKEKVIFKSEERRDLQSAAQFLHQLADKISQNQLTLLQGQQEITIDIPDAVVLEIKVEEEQKKNKDQMSLEIELKWMLGDETGGPLKLG